MMKRLMTTSALAFALAHCGTSDDSSKSKSMIASDLVWFKIGDVGATAIYRINDNYEVVIHEKEHAASTENLPEVYRKKLTKPEQANLNKLIAKISTSTEDPDPCPTMIAAPHSYVMNGFVNTAKGKKWLIKKEDERSIEIEGEGEGEYLHSFATILSSTSEVISIFKPHSRSSLSLITFQELNSAAQCIDQPWHFPKD